MLVHVWVHVKYMCECNCGCMSLHVLVQVGLCVDSCAYVG